MHKELKRALLVVLGVAFIVLGFVGLALPFLQGFLFMAIGLILLSISSTRFRAWMRTHTTQYPRLHAAVEKTENWIVGITGKVDDDEGSETR